MLNVDDADESTRDDSVNALRDTSDDCTGENTARGEPLSSRLGLFLRALVLSTLIISGVVNVTVLVLRCCFFELCSLSYWSLQLSCTGGSSAEAAF